VRIAMLASPWVPVPPPAYGGTETMLEPLIRGLDGRGHDVVLVGHPRSEVGVPVLSPLREDDVGLIGQTACELAHVVLGYERAEAWGADLIHDHTLLGPSVGRPAVPVVVTNHGPFDALTTPTFERVARYASIVAISHAQAATAPTVPISSVIHHGLRLEEWPLGAGGDYVLFLGRMTADKGAHRAIRLARDAGIPLVIAAKMREPAEVAFFESEVRPLLHGDAHFVGEADRSSKRRLLAGARALLNPIAWPEPFGLVMIEALACGTPVVAPPLGAAPEIVEHGVNGFLYRSAAEAVAAIDATSTLDRSRCRELVGERFSVERMVDGHLEVFERLVPAGLPSLATRISRRRLDLPRRRGALDRDVAAVDRHGDPMITDVDPVPSQRPPRAG
jgi:glycosyltransferase involved in cell wall biosynthesis